MLSPNVDEVRRLVSAPMLEYINPGLLLAETPTTELLPLLWLRGVEKGALEPGERWPPWL